MKRKSISRRIIVGVLLAEILSTMGIVVAYAVYERYMHFRAFDTTLRGHAESILGAIGDADDAEDNLELDSRSITVPESDLFEARDENRRILGRSDKLPQDFNVEKLAREGHEGVLKATIGDTDYRFVIIQASRVVDPKDSNGGIVHQVTILYGSPTKQVWGEILEEVRFYSILSLLLLFTSAILIAWFLRGALYPLHQLASEASGISVRKWSFNPPESARATRELAPLTKALEVALDRLRQSFDQQRRFTSDAAHELKTGVAIIKSSLQLLTMRERSTEDYRLGLEICLQDCARLEEIVMEMLTLAKAEHELDRQKALPEEPLNLAECVEEGIQQLTSLAELKGVQVRLAESTPSPVYLTRSEGALITTNLLHNALQHSPAGSTVTVSLTKTVQFATLIVEDQGEGIPQELLPHVFEPFFRAEAARDRRSGGTGLGLAICKAICDRVKGDITITSKLGAGTRVLVHLPAING